MTEVISADTLIIGNFTCTKPVQILGEVIGQVNSKYDLEIGETGEVKGSVYAPHIKLRGVLEGSARAAREIEVFSGALVKGRLSAPAVNDQDASRQISCMLPL